MLIYIFPVIRLLALRIIFKSYWWIIVASLLIITFFTIQIIYVTRITSISSLSILDIISRSLLILSILIAALIIVARSKIYVENLIPKTFSRINLILLLILIICFSAKSIITFYIWFEASLIPTIFMVILWGYQPERIQASIYLIIYTVTASLPILVVFCILIYRSGHRDISIPNNW